MPTRDELKMLQALPLDLKVRRTQQRIREWVDYFGKDGVYVSFSGGKDSTVLLHIVREMYGNDIPAMFVNTGLEYPEIQRFVRGFENVEILTPKKNFREVISEYGYPIISKEVSQAVYSAINQGKIRHQQVRETNLWKRKFDPESEYGKKYPQFSLKKWDALFDADFIISHKCCNVMKKATAHRFEHETNKKPIIGTMAGESALRRTKWLINGCNAFDNHQISKPMSFWKEQDVLRYIKDNNIKIAEPYGDIVQHKCKSCGKYSIRFETHVESMYCSHCGHNMFKCLSREV